MFLCLRASGGFYLGRDPVSVMSGELVCRARWENEHQTPLFAVCSQHANIREASLAPRPSRLGSEPKGAEMWTFHGGGGGLKGAIPSTQGRARGAQALAVLSSPSDNDCSL